MSKYLVGAFIGVILVVIGELTFVCLGGIAMDTKGKAFPLEKFLAHRALQASIGQHVHDQSPIQADESNLRAGAKIYLKSCAACHGELNHPPPPFALGEYPPPPQLLPPKKGVSDDSAGETFWKVKNGIRLTGMPGFRDSLTELEMWQVSLLLSKSDKLSSVVLDSLKTPPTKSSD
jgi:mono/diheme cytochrome c family protein